MSTITTAHGKQIDFDAAANLMDDDIVAELSYLDGMSEQEAFDVYCAKHLEVHGVTFEPNTKNPAW